MFGMECEKYKWRGCGLELFLELFLVCFIHVGIYFRFILYLMNTEKFF